MLKIHSAYVVNLSESHEPALLPPVLTMPRMMYVGLLRPTLCGKTRPPPENVE